MGVEVGGEAEEFAELGGGEGGGLCCGCVVAAAMASSRLSS